MSDKKITPQKNYLEKSIRNVPANTGGDQTRGIQTTPAQTQSTPKPATSPKKP